MMRNNQKKLKELVREVMDQMHKRKYGKKISGRYRSSFHLIMSISLIIISHDICMNVSPSPEPQILPFKPFQDSC